MLRWLLICHLTMLIMKILQNCIYNMGGETNFSTRTNKFVALTYFLVLFPFLIIWNLVGTFMFILIQNDFKSGCVIQIFKFLENINK